MALLKNNFTTGTSNIDKLISNKSL